MRIKVIKCLCARRFLPYQALSDVNKMADNNVKLAPSALVSGFNDAYNKKIKIKENEIESIVNMLNEQLSSKYVDIEKESWQNQK